MTDRHEFELAIRHARVYRCSGSGSARERLAVIERGAVGFRAGRVAYVGPDRELSALETVDAEGDAVVPGFVDCHTHLVFAGSRAGEFARRMNGEDYRKIAAEGGGIMATVRATRDASTEALFEAAAARAGAMLRRGSTTIEIKSGYGLTREHELRLLSVARRLGAEGVARVVTTYLGAHVVPPSAQSRRKEYVDEVVQTLSEVADKRLADACDVYLDRGAFDVGESRRILTSAAKAGLAIRGHVGQFADLGGAELLSELGALSADHLEYVSDAGLTKLAERGVVATLLPGAWRTLRQTPPSADRFRRFGVRMAVATDCNPGTSPTVDLPLCASLAVRDAGLTPEEAVLALTVEAAAAVGLSQEVGQLDVGFAGDCVILPSADGRAVAYAFGGLEPWMVVQDGRIRHRSDRGHSPRW